MSDVFILLATYNGGRFLPEMLDSLRRQTWADWRLLARDDGSTDGTAAVLRQAATDPRVAVLRDQRGRLGSSGNFEALVGEAQRAGAEYLLLADQDDVWLPDKVERQLAALRRLEADHGRAAPLLVHTDLAVVDRCLRPLHPSYAVYAGLRHDPRRTLAALLVRNHVTGCATLMNRALAELALPVPQDAVIHDWWFGLCAAAAGQCVLLPEPAVLYRQHGTNTIGARRLWGKLLPARQGWSRRWGRLVASVHQALALEARLRERAADVPPDRLRLVEDYCRLFSPHRWPWDRLRDARRLKVVPHNAFWAMSLLARLVLVRADAGGDEALSKTSRAA